MYVKNKHANDDLNFDDKVIHLTRIHLIEFL